MVQHIVFVLKNNLPIYRAAWEAGGVMVIWEVGVHPQLSLCEFSQSYLFSHQGITRKDKVKLGVLEKAIA